MKSFESTSSILWAHRADKIVSGFAVVVALLMAGAGLTSSAQGASRPNVLVILTDDQGWGDLSLNGNTNLSTPNIDQLASDGASFDRFYVCPVCSPTRAEFLTGRYHPRGGVYSTSAGGERLDLDEKTIGDSFKSAGYRTAAFGKWHNGMQYPYHPNGRGFDEYYGFCSGHWGHYWNPMLEHNGEIVQGKGFLIDDLTDHAIDFIRESKDTPFFVYLPYNTPHSPMQVPDRWWKKFEHAEMERHNRDRRKENLPHIRAALAMCENIDWNVGRLIDTLKQAGKIDNTIIVFFCDNGPNGTRWNGDMKGRKGSTDEGGVRSPCLVRWSPRIPAGKRIAINGAAIDLHPTLAALCGIRTVNAKPFDGLDISAALLSNHSPAADKRIIVSHWRNRVSAKQGSYRLDNDGRLFDLNEDPGQRVDLASVRQLPAAALRAAVENYRTIVMPGYDDDNRPFLIAHPDAATTQIPARDGKGNGGIKRSSRHPNSSYFTNWTSLDDSITWKAEVMTTGDYEVEVYYSCPESDVGSEVELSFNKDRLSTIVAKAHPPQLVGAAEDRVKRAESYEQNWGRMNMGNIHLTAGTGDFDTQSYQDTRQQCDGFSSDPAAAKTALKIMRIAAYLM